jgi:hypothetical protein
MEKKECATCKELKSLRQFNFGKNECNVCETYECSLCSANKHWKDFSSNQMQKGEARKCRACTGQGTSTLDCTECNSTLSLTLFKNDSRFPPVCNECRREADPETMDYAQALTGEYVGHGLWDTLTGADDGSGV